MLRKNLLVGLISIICVLLLTYSLGFPTKAEDTRNVLVRAGQEKAKQLGLNLIPAFVNEQGTIDILKGALLTFNNSKWVLSDRDMIINVGNRPLPIEGIQLEKGEYAIIKNGKAEKQHSNLLANTNQATANNKEISKDSITKQQILIPSERTGLYITAICGTPCKNPQEPCPVFVLSPEEFNQEQKSTKSQRKPLGKTPLLLTDIKSGVYYVGVQAVIDEKVVGMKKVGPMGMLRPAYEDYMLDDLADYNTRGLRSGEPVMIDGKKMYPLLNWLKKWYKVEVKESRMTPVVALFLKKTANPSEWDQFYPKSINYNITKPLINMDDFWNSFNHMKTGKPAIEKEKRHILLDLLNRGGRVGLPEPEKGIIWVDAGGGICAKYQIPSDKVHGGRSSNASLSPITPLKQGLAQTTPSPPSILPKFDTSLPTGRNVVKVNNPNDFSVDVGLRSKIGGANFHLDKNDIKSLTVPDGSYDIYFVYSNEPGSLYKGDSFNLAGNGVEIKLVKVRHGNYGITKVK